VRLGSKAVRDGMVLSGGMTVMPVRSGNVWWGVVLRDLDQILPVLVGYKRRETDAADVLNSANGAIVVIDTSGVGQGDGGWNECVLQGFIKMLAVVLAQVHSIDTDDCFRVERSLRTMLPVSVIAPQRSDERETADNLLAYVALLFGAPNDASRRDFLDPHSSKW